MNGATEVFRYDVSEQLERLDPDNNLLGYFELLTDENSRLNLVSRETARVDRSADTSAGRFPGLTELAVESLLPFDRIPANAVRNYLDIGSGGGFPSIPILLTRSIEQVCLVERTRKKAGALRRMLQALDRSVRIEPTDFAEVKFGPQKFDLITMRLVRLDDRLLRKIAGLLADDGLFVYYARREADFSDLSLSAESFAFAPHGSAEVHACTVFTKKL